MSTQILVTYASKHGATAEIADTIGEALRQRGQSVDVKPVDEVGDLSGYGAFIIGSAVYVGQWRKEAAKFLEEHEALLTGRDVWLFSSGPTGEGEASEILNDWHFPEKLQPLADRIKPHDIALFHGALNMEELGFLEKMMIRGVKAPVGDFRDWDTIKDWAEAIDATLKESQPE
jgi:menaquinone-dependent protoporphyrinogen oxidase